MNRNPALRSLILVAVSATFFGLLAWLAPTVGQVIFYVIMGAFVLSLMWAAIKTHRENKRTE